MALAVVVSAISSDHFGPGGVIMAACVSAAVWSLLLFPLLGTHSPVAFAIALIVTLGLQGLGYGPAGAFLPETFPTRYRYSGAGVSYNLAGILGGAMPPLVAAPLAATFGSSAVGILLCALSLLSLLCTRALVETKDRDLRQTLPVTATHRCLLPGPRSHPAGQVTSERDGCTRSPITAAEHLLGSTNPRSK
jgi:MFS family permease